MLASSRETLRRANACGRDKSRPYGQILCFEPTGMAPPTRAAVGRDALIPPHPAPPRTPAGGYGIRPYNQRRARGQPGNRCPCVIINLCRGRCLHRSADLALPQGLREGHGPPLQTMVNARPTGMAPPTRAAVGRNALIPPHSTPPRTPRADMESAPTTNGGRAACRETATPALHQIPVGDDARIVPGDLMPREPPRAG